MGSRNETHDFFDFAGQHFCAFWGIATIMSPSALGLGLLVYVGKVVGFGRVDWCV